MADKLKALVIGPGNIGTDLLMKARRSEWIEPVWVVGVEQSEGIQRAQEMGVKTCITGIDGVLQHVVEDDIRIAFDATSAYAHADHARSGHDHYWATAQSAPILYKRLGRNIELTPIEYGEKLTFGAAQVSFHPAGHVLGSAQIRVEVDPKRRTGRHHQEFAVVTQSTLSLFRKRAIGKGTHTLVQASQRGFPIIRIGQLCQRKGRGLQAGEDP